MSMTLRLLLLGSCAWCSLAAQAMAVSSLGYTFIQNGYSGGATVTGTFSGVDLDNNGLLVHFPLDSSSFPIAHLELTSLSMHFSGNSLSPAFDLTLDDVFGFVYEIGSSGIGDDPAYDPTLDDDLIEGIGIVGSLHFYSSGLGPNTFIGGYVGGPVDPNGFGRLADYALDSSQQLLLVVPVPEAEGIGMMIAAGSVVTVLGRARCSSLFRCSARSQPRREAQGVLGTVPLVWGVCFGG